MLPIGFGVVFSQDQCPWTSMERDCIKVVSYASTMDSLKYEILCARPNICFAIGIMSGY